MRKALLILLPIVAFLPFIVFAQNVIEIKNPLAAKSFEDLLNNLITWLFNIAIFLAPLMLIFAGFLFVTAAGDPNQVQKAKDLIWWTIIGLVIILLAKGLVTMLKQIVGVE